MVSAVDLNAAAESIWAETRRGVHHPVDWRGKLSVTDGYQVLLKILERHVRTGDGQVGWKVGLTAEAIQRQFGVHEPVFGLLLKSGTRASGAVFQFGNLIQPGFENELCLTIGTTLRGPGVSLGQARAAVSAVAPALEIVERRGDLTGDLGLAVADNSQQKAFVTGSAVAPPDGFHLSEATVEVLVNGHSMERATGAEVMGDPAASIAWLANKLAEFGYSLETGMVVMSGSFTRQYSLAAGDRVEARFDPFGSVSAEFR
jgi:2-keto-4-pentenoate hydratase